jgi:Flp pilus assembly protein TadG
MKLLIRKQAEEGQRGQALVEFAFVAPFLLVLLLVILDFGVAIDRREVLQHAVREGARQGAVGATVAEIKNVTANQSQDVLDPADVSVCYVDGDGGTPAGQAGSNVRVTANYAYNIFFGAALLNYFGSDDSDLSVPMTPDAEARMEMSLGGVTEC